MVSAIGAIGDGVVACAAANALAGVSGARKCKRLLLLLGRLGRMVAAGSLVVGGRHGRGHLVGERGRQVVVVMVRVVRVARMQVLATVRAHHKLDGGGRGHSRIVMVAAHELLLVVAVCLLLLLQRRLELTIRGCCRSSSSSSSC